MNPNNKTCLPNACEDESIDIYHALFKDLVPYKKQVNGVTGHCIEDSRLFCLSAIDKFVSAVLDSNADGFIRIDTPRQNGSTAVRFDETALSKHFLRIGKYISDIEEYDSIYVFSEKIQLFQKTYRNLRLSEYSLINPVYLAQTTDKHEGDLFNDLIQAMRSESQTPAFKKRLSNRISNGKRMLDSINTYIDELFDRHVRLLVIRIDLEYLAELYPNTNRFKAHVPLEDATADFARLKNNMRHNKLFEHMKGYVWKLEYGEKKGIHYHLILFFDGSERRKDAHLGNLIGQYWVESITKMRGHFHNCNARKDYSDLGIGMIHAEKPEGKELLHNLQTKVVGYLAKKEQYLKAKLTGNERVMGKGQLPPKKSNAGRPRTLR